MEWLSGRAGLPHSTGMAPRFITWTYCNKTQRIVHVCKAATSNGKLAHHVGQHRRRNELQIPLLHYPTGIIRNRQPSIQGDSPRIAEKYYNPMVHTGTTPVNDHLSQHPVDERLNGMSLSNLLKTAAGTCPFCNQKAGILSREHNECRRKLTPAGQR